MGCLFLQSNVPVRRGGQRGRVADRTWYLPLLIGLALAWGAGAATLTVQTNQLGATPELLGYNSGHFFPGSNTRDWWRYAGVNGARVFMSPAEVEFSDDLAPVGDGVTTEAGFLSRKAALRADPLNTSYINWPYFLNRYENNDLYPINHIRINYTLGELHALGVRICAQITASENRLPIIDAGDWGGKWELWQHYYAQAFYLGREFDVERYQMFNEPNHSNANGLTQANYLMRLQLVSDAVQSALADVNTIYGKSLAPNLLAPVTAGSAESSYTGGWGELVVDNRHVDFLGQTDPNFWLVNTYDYHQYNSTPSSFGSSLSNLNGFLDADMAPEPRFPTAISEFNVHTGATFDGLTETLDDPVKYSRFGAIVVNLMENECNEFYAFKFSQTAYTGNYPVAKNAMHYVDNSISPYNIGSITKAGEVYRLFNKAFAAGRDRLNTLKGAGATDLDLHASYDPVRHRHHLFSANNTSSGVALDVDLSAWNIPVGNRVLLEEVSETSYGGGVLWTTVPASRIISATQESNSVWLLHVPALAQAAEQIIAATDDAQVRDGANKTLNYGTDTAMTARNDPASTANRSVALMKFQIPPVPRSDIQFAVLSLQASTVSTESVAQAHVYGLDSAGWSEGSVTWATAPNLKDNVPAGNTINSGFVEDAGGTAHILGQLVVNSTTVSERLIDVTDFIRDGTNAAVSFMVSQDPRWDVTLPSLVAGDTQPDGVRIVTSEGGTGPRLRLVLNSLNTPPVATNDVYAATEDIPLVVGAPGVLANDYDANTNALTAILVGNATNGSVVLAPDGAFTYTPDINFNGLDSFTYQASDGVAESAVTTVDITVASVNDLPIALDDSGVTTQNTPVIIDVLANDSDADGGTLSVVSFTQGAGGSVSNNGNGTLTYAPNLNVTGPDSFGYTIIDGQGGTNSASVNVLVYPVGVSPYWTNVLAGTEAFVRGGANAATDQDEIATGYLMIKYNPSPFDTSRKAYFDFDLSGRDVNVNTAATFTVTTHTTTFRHRAQLWGLDQAYPGFNANITWNTAQANDTTSNDLLVAGPETATPIGASFSFSSAASTTYDFAVPNIGDFLLDDHVVLVFTGADDPINNAGGLRLALASAFLQVQVLPPAPVSTNPAAIMSIALNPDQSVTMDLLGTPGVTYRVQAATNLHAAAWFDVSTNTASTNGLWTVTDVAPINLPQRFYRAVTP